MWVNGWGVEMDLFIVMVGSFIVGYVVGAKLMKHKILTMLAILKMQYEDEVKHGIEK